MAFTENFRQIEFNPDKEIREIFRATQGDTKSQGFNVVVVLGGEKKVITTETMSFVAQKPDRTTVSDMAVKDGDGFKIELKNQVFAVPGVVVCTLVLRGANGEKLAGRQFKILVAGSMEDGAIISEDERGILDRAFDLATDIVPRLEGLDVPLLENVNNELETKADKDYVDGQDALKADKTYTDEQLALKADLSEIEAARGTKPTLGARLDGIDEQLADARNDIGDLQAFVGYTDDDIMGVEVDFKNKKFTRLEGAVNRTPGADFDNILAFGGRRRCNLADDGIVNAYFGDAGYIEDGSNGQVMVEQPKFYYKVVPLQLDKVVDGKGFHNRKARYYVSDVKKTGFKLHPAFIHNGKEKNFIYLSAYEGSIYDKSAEAYLLADEQIADFTVTTGDKLSSIAYAKPASGLTQDLTRAKTRIIANNRGTGWNQAYAATVAATQLLFAIEYASFNTQSKIGNGVQKADDGATNQSEPTGATTLLGNTSGSVANGSVSYRGEENWWGNIWKWVDGLNIYAYGEHSLFVADNGFTDNSNAAPYKDAGITIARSNGYISAFAYNEKFDWLFFASETLGDSALPVGDYNYQNHAANSWHVALFGGYWNYSSYGGGFYWYVPNASSSRGRSIGGRLVYVPDVA